MAKKIIKSICVFGLLMLGFVVIFSLTIIANTPKIDPNKLYDYLSESSIIYDDQDNVIDSIYLAEGNRTNIKYRNMPKNMINAIVAIEDKTFWKHNGFNIWRIGGAIKESLTSGGNISGTSTITQQLARNVYLSETKSVRSLGRKISEAYYTVVLEKNLSKRKIMEAYLNTISFGYNSYGIQSAAKAYFGKDASKLTLAECVALAAIPKASTSYALVTKISRSSGAKENQKAANNHLGKVLYQGEDYTYVYNGDRSKNRREAILRLMVEQNYITKEEAEQAKKVDLAKCIKIDKKATYDSTTYFIDYLVSDLKKDLMKKYHYTAEEAEQVIYAGGLKIHTTLNTKAQQAIETGFSQSGYFPSVSNIKYDNQGNVVSDEGNIQLYNYNRIFDSNGNIVLKRSDFRIKNGNVILKPGKKLKFIKTNVNDQVDYSIELKKIFTTAGGYFQVIDGGFILIPQKYKTLNGDGSLTISKKFFKTKNYKSYYNLKNGKIRFSPSIYRLKTKTKQPQAAMVIIDYKTGGIKAMMGGREYFGQKLFNRATSPRQPGSSIKPLAVYSSALQQGADAAEKGTPLEFKELDKNQRTNLYGDYWTASSGINDAPLTVGGKVWPKNWYRGYRGVMTLRKSVEQSVNVNAVRVFQQVGSEYAMSQLEKFGVSSLVKSGAQSDNNASALALGGMTRGISPLEMAGAYGTFPNKGVHIDPVSYTSVENKHGKEILFSAPQKRKVISEEVAFIMQDILRTTVTRGVASNANIYSVPVAGKTGTTSDQKDIWFCGFTPQYVAALWIGNDMNLPLSEGSPIAAKLWSVIMQQAVSGMYGELPTQPSGVVKYGGEYYVSGTQSGIRYYSENYIKQKERQEKNIREQEEEAQRILDEENKLLEEDIENE